MFASPQRWEVLKENIGSSLHSMPDTRWSARVDSVKPMAIHIPGVKKAVEIILEHNLKPQTQSEVVGVLKYLEPFQSLLMAIILVKILTPIDYRNRILQA